jgi:formate dehydrogenase subunit gamma
LSNSQHSLAELQLIDGMEGAFEAMSEGTVDLNWAKEHHSLWLEEQLASAGANESGGHPAATPAE